jgi:hypothetical protein
MNENRLVVDLLLCGLDWATAEALVARCGVEGRNVRCFLEALRAGWPDGTARLRGALADGARETLDRLAWEAYAYLVAQRFAEFARGLGEAWEQLRAALTAFAEALGLGDEGDATPAGHAPRRVRRAPRTLLLGCTRARASPRRPARWSPLYGVRR